MVSGNYFFNFTGIKIITIEICFIKEIVSFFMGLFLKQKISFLWVFLENNEHLYLEIHTSAHLAILI